ncbi:hypothetical protein [Plastoroseomonas arctica]|uniref:Uncharacterized protein n=1 Tax=Plastoroseomonas arctica TaxID=1509237 RepID=A0AAF1K4Y3_9PROT|nr:hypothetical protein [Plastoroseomonas arctica]MBR0656199.1 hypothetical protein [Plastoroseomonas arctica]
MSRFALSLVIMGLLMNALLVLLLLGDALLPMRLSLSAAAVLAVAGGVSLVGGLTMIEPRRMVR